MKKSLSIIIILVLTLLVFTNMSYAANIGVSGETVSCYKGDTISMSFTTSGISASNQLGALQASLGSLPAGISVISVTSNLTGAGSANNIITWMPSGIDGFSSNFTITVKLKVSDSIAIGTYSIPLQFATLMDLSGNSYKKTVTGTVKVIEKETPTNPGDNENPQQPQTPKSSDNALKTLSATANGTNLNITKDGTKYLTTVESDINKVTFTVIANSTKATIDTNVSTSGLKLSLNSKSDGKKVYTISDLKESGNNVARVTIIAENGAKKDYTFVVTRKVDTTTQEETPPNIIDEPTGEDNKPEDNEPTDAVLGLKNLVITGVEISPEFKEDVYEYTAKVEKDESVEVLATPTIEGATVEIIGNNNLLVGENIVTIIVKNGEETKTYQVIITKEEVKEVTSEIKPILSKEINWKYILIIAAGAIIAIIIIIKLVSMSRKTIDENGEVIEEKEETKSKGKRFK